MSAPGRTGLVLFAHGARDAQWAQPFEAVARQVRAQRPQCEVRLAYLEFLAPALPEAGAQLVAAGCTRVRVLPLFLGQGGHLKRDLPQLVDALRAAHPQVSWHLHRAAGEWPALIDAMAALAAQALTAGDHEVGP
jgi:sirohydrochlorin cobaltochelatase